MIQIGMLMQLKVEREIFEECRTRKCICPKNYFEGKKP
jgi:hypothetical protein